MSDTPHLTHDERMDALYQTLDGPARWLAWERDYDIPRPEALDTAPYPVGHPLCPEE